MPRPGISHVFAGKMRYRVLIVKFLPCCPHALSPHALSEHDRIILVGLQHLYSPLSLGPFTHSKLTDGMRKFRSQPHTDPVGLMRKAQSHFHINWVNLVQHSDLQRDHAIRLPT